KLETPQQEGPSLAGLNFGKGNVVDFWAAELAAVKTEKTSSGRLGWIADDDDESGSLRSKGLHLVSFVDLTMQRREELVISPPPGGDLHKVDFSRVEPASTPDMTSRQHRDCVFSAINGEPSILQAAKEDDEQTIRELAKVSFKALRESESPLGEYRLDGLCAPSHTKEVADRIGLVYGRAPSKAKTELHIGQINMEIKRLRAVRSQYSAKISALECEAMSLKAREAKADDEDRIVQKMCEELRALEADRDAREAARDHDSGDKDVAAKETTAAGSPAAPTPVRPAGFQAEYDDDEMGKIEVLMAASR
ncbi:hypothetical protein MMC22_005647, partial [Lobaria immixta]|nr:hypothetical protein [Lobaria immixta]